MLGFVPLPNLPEFMLSLFRRDGESGKYSPHPYGSPASRLLRNSKSFQTILCMPISLTTLGHPTVLVYSSTALLTLSGVWLKLAALTNLSGTDLDAGGARRVSGMDATNQTLASSDLNKCHSSSAQTGN